VRKGVCGVLGVTKLGFAGSVDYSSLNYRAPNHQPLVYYVTNGEFIKTPTTVMPFKVGATNQLARRFKAYCRTRADFTPYIVAVEVGDTRREAARHLQFSGDRVAGDWFWPTEEAVEQINHLWEEGRQCSDLNFLSFIPRT